MKILQKAGLSRSLKVFPTFGHFTNSMYWSSWFCEKIWVVGGLSQCENYIIFMSLRFCVKSVFEDIEILKMPFLGLCLYVHTYFVHLVSISLQKVKKFMKNQYSEPHNVLKWQIFRLKIGLLWFHVKSEWQKKSVISTLCLH